MPTARFSQEVRKFSKSADYRFYIVGAGDFSDLIPLIYRDRNVVHVGKVPVVSPVVLKGRVCVAPLVSGAGFRGKTVQYAELGRPCVSTSIGVSGLAFRNDELILVEDSPDLFAKRVVDLISNSDDWERITSSAIETANEYCGWGPRVLALESLYNSQASTCEI